jgi:malonate transporter and related proteins
MLAAIVSVLAPVFALIALGSVAVRSGYMAADDIRALGRFVIGVALPALIFVAVSGAPLSETLAPSFLLAYWAGSLLVFGFGFWRALAAKAQAPALQALGMGLSNSGYVGLPIALLVLGDGAVRVLAHTMIVENLLILPLALALAEWQRRSGSGVAASLRGVAGELLRNPIVIALVAGLAVGGSGILLPDVAGRTVRLLAGVSAPVALFVVGGMIASVPVTRPTTSVAWVVGGKLALHPLLVVGALVLLAPPDPLLVAGGVLFASAPMLGIYPILGQRYGAEALTATALVAATVASVATMTIVIALLAGAGLVSLPA